MDTRGRIHGLPLGGIIDGYLGRAFLRIFFSSLLVTTSLYIIVHFFDRISIVLDSGAPVWTVIRYFLYNAPLSISRVIGFATLFSTLFCLGMAPRTNEITAMRSSGISVQRIAFPLLILSMVIGLFTFFWNEGLVPSSRIRHKRFTKQRSGKNNSKAFLELTTYGYEHKPAL